MTEEDEKIDAIIDTLDTLMSNGKWDEASEYIKNYPIESASVDECVALLSASKPRKEHRNLIHGIGHMSDRIKKRVYSVAPERAGNILKGLITQTESAKEMALRLGIEVKQQMTTCPVCKKEYPYWGVDTPYFCSVGCQFSD